MTFKKINILIALALASLLGVVVMQVFWVHNAIQLKEKQFNNSIDIAMKTVLNRILEANTGQTLRQLALNEPCLNEKTNITDVIPPKLLDSLIHAELQCLKVTKGFEYAVYSKVNNRFAMGNYRYFKEELLQSAYQQSVEALFKPGSYFFTMYFPEKTSRVFMQLMGWMLLSALFLLAVVTTFWITIRTVYRQKRWSEMKTDFINNMTHEFKTPISTIAVASEMLLKEEIHRDSDRTKKYVGVIISENNRLQNQVEQVLQSAILEKDGLRMRLKPTDIHRLIQQTIENFQLRIQEVNGSLKAELLDSNINILADRHHLSNVLANLIDNAIKYTPAKPVVKVLCRTQNDELVIEVSDNGIGISKENQQRIFRNLFRVHTGDVHDVKGFGIGLFYVQKIIEIHGGRVEVESELGHGSVFRLFLPYNSKQ
jgi:two-component system phosphate regulon sensor histidine kinase PhoR